jgi:hypothetical protein
LAATLPLGCDGINDREMQPTEEIQASDFAIYPNPTNDKFTVGFAKPFSGEIMVYNLQGIQLMKYTVKDALQTDISLQNTAAGMYIVQLQGIDGSKQIGKIVKVE